MASYPGPLPLDPLPDDPLPPEGGRHGKVVDGGTGTVVDGGTGTVVAGGFGFLTEDGGVLGGLDAFGFLLAGAGGIGAGHTVIGGPGNVTGGTGRNGGAGGDVQVQAVAAMVGESGLAVVEEVSAGPV